MAMISLNIINSRRIATGLQACLRLFLLFTLSGALAAQPPLLADQESHKGRLSPQVSASTITTDDNGGDAIGMATGIATSAASNTAEQWLSQFGTAQVSLRADRRFTLQGSSLDLLVPLLDTPSSVFFIQGGGRYSDDRVTTNLGLGQRLFTGGWLLGYNAFYDMSWNNINRRWGLGLEAWRDNLRFSSNLYQGITDWHSSRQHDGYDERPADGWDIRVDGWLPFLPQIGMKAVYEQYYGNDVALFSNFADRQKNPYAVTLGLNYTPVPLITFGVEQKIGKGGMNDTAFTAGLNYRFGDSLSKQTSPAAVSSLRSINSSRLDLVNRNNEIVLNYRKQTELSLGFPATLSGEEGSEVTFIPTLKTSNGLDRIELNDAALMQAGGKVLSASGAAITVRMPAWQPEPIRLSGVAVDRKGNRSNMAETLLTVSRKETMLSVSTNKNGASADGKDAIVVTLHLTDRSGTPLAEESVTWQTSGGQLSAVNGKTDSNGNASVSLTSTVAGNFTVTAGVNSKTATSGTLTFRAEVPVVTIAVDKTSVAANGSDAATYTVAVKNAASKPVANQKVNWATNFGTLSATSGNTDANGLLIVKLTSTAAGQATVSATVAGQTLSAQLVTFTAQSTFGQPSLNVPTVPSISGQVINIQSSMTTKYTTRYSGMQAGDVITLSFAGVDNMNGRHNFSYNHTVTTAEASSGAVAMGPYPSELSGIEPPASLNNGTFTSKVTRPSTGESKSVSVTVTVDTVP